MSEISFGEMLDESFKKSIRPEEIVEGKVIDVTEDHVFLDLGSKLDGYLSKQEYSSDPNVVLTDEVKEDDVMDVKVLKVNDGEGYVLVSRKRVMTDRVNERLKEAFENGEVLTATVARALNGGLSVTCEGSRIFIPASLVSDMFERDLKKFVGQDIEFKIIEFDPKRRRIIGDRKQLVIEKKAKAQEELLARIAVGDIVDGTVKNVTDFGAFVDLGGADGLLHISEMSWGRVDNVKSLFKVGMPLKVLIKDINGKKIALSLKFEDQNPWLNASEKYASGKIVEGRIARMTDFGAFVELEPGVDALLHVSQISRDRVEKPSDVLQINQVVTAKIVDFNGEDKKISLSMKALEPKSTAPAPEASPVAEPAEEPEASPVGEVSAQADGGVAEEPEASPVGEVSAIADGEVTASPAAEVSAQADGEVTASPVGEVSAQADGEVTASPVGEVSAIADGEVTVEPEASPVAEE